MVGVGFIIVVVSLLLNDVTCCYEDNVDFKYYKTICEATEIPRDIPVEAREVWVNHNYITDIQLGVFSNLTECFDLELDTNKLTILKSGMFEGLKSLRRLNLGHNVITQIETGSFENLQLDELYLDHYSLTSPIVEQDVSNSFPFILTLGENLFHCDSAMCWIKEAKRDGRIIWLTEDGFGKPECQNYPDVEWDDVRLDCSDSGEPLATGSLDNAVFIVVGVFVGMLVIFLFVVVFLYKVKGWRITTGTTVVKKPTAPRNQLGRPEVPELIPKDDYFDESKVHPLLPRETRPGPIGSDGNHPVHPGQNGARL